MTAFDPNPAERWLFVFPHPDDEIAIIGWIHHLQSLGIPLACAWVHATPVREAESRAVFRPLGIDTLQFGPGEDGHFVEQLPQLGDWLRSVAEEFRPTRIVTTAFEQGHLDHDATNFLINRVPSVPVLELPLYHPYDRIWQTMNQFAGEGKSESRHLTPEEHELKCRLLRAYPSQRLGTILQTARTIKRLTGRPDPFLTEHLRFQTHVDFARPNHAPRDSARIIKSCRWARWISAIKDVD
jgi:LmbE family N-acetylglucosaminyl deacetylase